MASILWSPQHRDAPWLHFPGGCGTRVGAQPHLGGFVLPDPDTRNIPALSERWLHSSLSYWAQLVLQCEHTRLELDRAPTAPAVLDFPSLPQRLIQCGPLGVPLI